MPELDVDLLRQARHHLQLAIENSDSLVPIRLTRAHVDAQIAATLLQLHKLDGRKSIDASASEASTVSDSFALDAIARAVREYRQKGLYDAGEIVGQIVEALKESGRSGSFVGD